MAAPLPFVTENKLFRVNYFGKYLDRVYNAWAGAVKVLVTISNVKAFVFDGLQIGKAGQLQ